MGILRGKCEAVLAIRGPKFERNTVDFIRSNKVIHVGCPDGFENNKVDIFGQPKSGRFTTGLGTSITGNEFKTMTVGPVSSFATADGNTAEVATAEGPCNVLNVKKAILDYDFLAIPDGDRECAELFRKYLA